MYMSAHAKTMAPLYAFAEYRTYDRPNLGG